MTWTEFKKLVEAAGVQEGDAVDDLHLMTNTNGCNCPLSEIGEHPVTIAGCRTITSSASLLSQVVR